MWYGLPSEKNILEFVRAWFIFTDYIELLKLKQNWIDIF